MDWPAAAARLATPLFAPLHPALARLPAGRWPTHEELNRAAAGLATAGGRALRFVPPAAAGDTPYELRIAATGEVPTRERNWHDLFNALAWMAYPRAKAAINAQHAAILEAGGAAERRRRSPQRDALTLFDEGGVAVAAADPALAALIPAYAWKELFWERRGELAGRVAFLAFGHACFEQALDPYIGMVAKTVCLPVDAAFFALPVAARVAHADRLLAAHFADRARFASPRAMPPLPVLGVPGWHPATEREDFYDDASYFRTKGLRPARGRGGGTAVPAAPKA